MQTLGFGNKAIYYVGAVVPSLGWLSGADSKLTDMVVSCGGSGRTSWPSQGGMGVVYLALANLSLEALLFEALLSEEK